MKFIKSLDVQRIGNSKGIILPPKLIKSLELDRATMMLYVKEDGSLILKKYEIEGELNG